MAYYDALIAKWPSLTGTTAQKLASLNALTVTGTVPSTIYVTGSQILNCINWAEFSALTSQQQSNILALCDVQGSLLGGTANTAFMVDGMLLSYFSHTGATVTALIALAQGAVQPWWQANGYPGPFNNNDLTAAGGLS